MVYSRRRDRVYVYIWVYKGNIGLAYKKGKKYGGWGSMGIIRGMTINIG